MNPINKEFPSHFESQRLFLRSYRAGDGQWYYQMSLRNREHLQRFEADNVAANISSEAAAEDLVRELSEDFVKGRCYFIGAFDKVSGEFVAQVYVGPVNGQLPEFEVGYIADVDHEGRGYVTEAVKATLGVLFNQMGAHRVRLGCDETNLRSIRVAERCQMTREGRLRENRRNPDGTYSSSLIYGLLKTEYIHNIHEGVTFTKELPREGNIPEIEEFLAAHWGSFMVVSKGKISNAARIPRIVCRGSDGKLVGLLTYQYDRDNQSCEVVTLNSEIKGLGIGTKLITLAEELANANGCGRMWLITTNDNPEAALFYIKRGFKLVAVHLGALEYSRKLKPQIPLIGKHGILLTDEWEFEKAIPLEPQAGKSDA